MRVNLIWEILKVRYLLNMKLSNRLYKLIYTTRIEGLLTFILLPAVSVAGFDL
jgi:hypothetical protein